MYVIGMLLGATFWILASVGSLYNSFREDKPLKPFLMSVFFMMVGLTFVLLAAKEYIQ